MKKCLHVAIDSQSYSSLGITKGLQQHFEEVIQWNWQPVWANEGPIGMWERLIAKAHMEDPDVVFIHIQSGGKIDADVLRSLPERAFTILYTMDVRDDIGWIKDLAPHLGLVVVPDQNTANDLKQSGFNNVIYSHSSADFDVYKFYNPGLLCQPFGPKIVFIGNNYAQSSLDFPKAKERVELVEFLQSEYREGFHVYGQGWKGSKYVNPHDEINIYSCARIAVTHNNFYRNGYSSDRIWRSMGCGVATISQYYPGINMDFNKSVIATWLNFDMLKERIEYLLEHDSERQMMAMAGALWVRERHSWADRFQNILNFMKKMKNELGQQSTAN